MKTIILLINLAFIATVLAAPKPQYMLTDEYGNPQQEFHQFSNGEVFYQPINYEPLVNPMMMMNHPLQPQFPPLSLPRSAMEQQQWISESEPIEIDGRSDQQNQLMAIDDEDVKLAVNMINEQPDLVEQLVEQYGLTYTEKQLSHLLETVLAHPVTQEELDEINQLAELEKELIKIENNIREMEKFRIDDNENDDENNDDGMDMNMDTDNNDENNNRPAPRYVECEKDEPISKTNN